MISDIYFTPQYGECCEYSDDAIWEVCVYKDLIYVYLKKPLSFANDTYYDLITPYGYSGYMFKEENTFEEFVAIFRIEAQKKKYITEVVRQNPYVEINLTKYDNILSRTTFGILLKKYENFDQYLTDTDKGNRRAYRNGCKHNLVFELNKYEIKHLINFRNVYETTMTKLKSKPYYFFNEIYYEKLINLKDNILFANVYKDNKLISSCMIFKFNKNLHYHIGGSLIDYRKLNPNNYLHCKIIEYGIKNSYNLYHMGGGLNDNDTLYDFKKKICNKEFKYTIYKNILNHEIYDKIKQNYIDTGYFPIHREI